MEGRPIEIAREGQGHGNADDPPQDLPYEEAVDARVGDGHQNDADDDRDERRAEAGDREPRCAELKPQHSRGQLEYAVQACADHGQPNGEVAGGSVEKQPVDFRCGEVADDPE